MHTIFEEKRQKLLSDFRMLALKHNREYYRGLIPFIETATPDQEDLLDMYEKALRESSGILQSRKAFTAPHKIQSLL